MYTVLEHEPMHQETLRYMWHRLPYDKKIRPAGEAPIETGGGAPRPRAVRIPPGEATLGATLERVPFGWDNEFPEHRVHVPGFEIDVFNVTNGDFMEFVEAGGYGKRELWDEEGWEWRSRGGVEHPLFWERANGELVLARDVRAGPAARGLARLRLARGGAGLRPLEGETAADRGGVSPRRLRDARAARSAPTRGEKNEPDETRGNFDFRRSDPVPVGSFPAGASAWGVEDLVGNGWEWTSTVFGGFPGFEPMASYPVYSTDFFDGKHWVMKGASPATAKELLRRSFRNWFRGNYPYVYADVPVREMKDCEL